MSHPELLKELQRLQDLAEEVRQQGDHLRGCSLSRVRPGGTARTEESYYALRSRQPCFGGKKSKYVRKSEVAAVRAALARGRELARLEREIAAIGEKIDRKIALAKREGLELPKPRPHQVLFSSESNEWYTNPHLIELARQVMGGIDTDPASNSTAQQWIKASTWYSIENDGFDKPWLGRVWLNPPYGTRSKTNHGVGAWIERLILQFDEGITQQGVILARGDSNGIKAARKRFPCCEPDQRIRFIRADGTPSDRPVPGCRFFYLGHRVAEFERVFGEIGVVTFPRKTA